MSDKVPTQCAGGRRTQLRRWTEKKNDMRIRSLVALLTLALCGCVSTPRNYVPAGFGSAAEVRPYISPYLYFASKITPAEWNAFYVRFPEYFKDMQAANQLGSTMEYHPWYVAYAFRWTTLQRRNEWPPELIVRLERGDTAIGDDVFRVVYALGPPARVVWNNDAEVLLYANDVALVLNSSMVVRKESCVECSARLHGKTGIWKLNEKRVLSSLAIQPPAYSAK